MISLGVAGKEKASTKIVEAFFGDNLTVKLNRI
jgi:hypothetical protein